MRELLHGGRIAQKGDERAEHDQRTGGAHALGALGIIRADGDEGGERRAGEQLVTVGQQYLSDGDAVRVVEG